MPYFKWDKNGHEYSEDTYDEAIVNDPNGGCDLKYRLNLRFHQEFYSEEAAVNTCNEYVWPLTGERFTETDHHVVRTFQHGFGDQECDSTYVLDITIRNAPESHGIHCENPHAIVFSDPNFTDSIVAVITNTEFFSFQYDFMVEETNPESTWKSCSWAISKPSWTIEFDTVPEYDNGQYRSRCKVYVADRDNNLVILTSTVKNDCGNKVDTIYLKSSFLGVDEQGTTVDFSIAPNPNNGQMTLHLNGFSGNVGVKVYGSTGNCIDQFEIGSEMEGQPLPYDLPNHASGVYFFVVTGREGVLAKKVIIR